MYKTNVFSFFTPNITFSFTLRDEFYSIGTVLQLVKVIQ